MVTMVTQKEACTGSPILDTVPQVVLACDSLQSQEHGSSAAFSSLPCKTPSWDPINQKL